MVRALRSRQDIPKGTELFVAYGYQFKIAPLWYKDALLRFIDEHPGEEFRL